MEPIQLDLFEGTGIDIQTKSKKPTQLIWSFSKRGVLEQCPRKYYYEYYGSNLNTAKNYPKRKNFVF